MKETYEGPYKCGIEDDCSHFICGDCGKLKTIEQMNVVKTAFNFHDKNTQEDFYYRPYFMMVCDECLSQSKKVKKHGRNNNSKRKRSS